MFTDTDFMKIALDEAGKAFAKDEAPIGAVLVQDGRIIAQAHNAPITLCDPSAHAEMLALRTGAKEIGNYRLTGASLYVTLEPCAMCAGAIAHARIARLYYGADDPKGGGVIHGPRVFTQPTVHHRPEVYDGIGAGEAAGLLKDFFAARR